MADIFTNVDIKMLFRGKFILILGSSNFRAVYRDIIWLLNFNKIIPEGHLRRKLDFSYLGDRLIKQGELNRGRDYVEMREYKKDGFHIKYNFITKCLTKEVEEMMHDIHERNCKPPDIVIVNSCLWDITRWGPNGVTLYKDNMRKLFSIMKSSLPSTTLVIFSTTPPVSQSCSAAFLVRQVEFMRHSLRFEVMEANLFARQLVPTYGYNILDLHYHLRMQIHRRIRDGVHWVPTAVRHMTNLFLTHISLSWGVPLPGNFCGALLQSMKLKAKMYENIHFNSAKIPRPSMFQHMLMPPPSVPVKQKKGTKSILKRSKYDQKMGWPHGYRERGLKLVEANSFLNHDNQGNMAYYSPCNSFTAFHHSLEPSHQFSHTARWPEYSHDNFSMNPSDGKFFRNWPDHESYFHGENSGHNSSRHVLPRNIKGCSDHYYREENFYEPSGNFYTGKENHRYVPYDVLRRC